MQKLTRTNLWVLAQTFKTSTRVSNQIRPTDVPHLRRCMNAGLVRAEGAELVLTEDGEQALRDA